MFTFLAHRGMPTYNPTELALRDCGVRQRNAHHQITTPEGRETFSWLITYMVYSPETRPSPPSVSHLSRRPRGRAMAKRAKKSAPSKRRSRIEKSLEAIVNNLQQAHDSREFLIRNTRDAVLMSGRAIIEIHRGNYGEAEQMIAKAAGMIESYRKKAGRGQKHLLTTPEQEMVEASALLAVVRGRQIPSPTVLGVSDEGYALGLMDALGEIKRHVVDLLRRDQMRAARSAFKSMEDLYAMLYPFVAMDRVLRESRRKMDVGRIQLEDARVLLVQAQLARKPRKTRGSSPAPAQAGAGDGI